MPTQFMPPHHDGQSAVYQIRLQGRLGSQWQAWFQELTITAAEGGDTLQTTPPLDQAALYGLLRKVRDLGIPLVSVMRLDPDGTGETTTD